MDFFGAKKDGAKQKTPEQLASEQRESERKERLRQQQVEATKAYTRPTRLGRSLNRTPSNLSVASSGASVCRSVSPVRRGRSPSAKVDAADKAMVDLSTTTSITMKKPKKNTNSSGFLGNVAGDILRSFSNPLQQDEAPNNLSVFTGNLNGVASMSQESSTSAIPTSPMKTTFNTSEVNDALNLGDAVLAKAQGLFGVAAAPAPGLATDSNDRTIENVHSDLTDNTGGPPITVPTSATAATPATSPASKTLGTPSFAPSLAGSRRKASTASKGGLDLKNNDNGFHVIATMITKRYADKIEDGVEKYYVITTEDRQILDRTISPKVKANFVEAVQYRILNSPKDSQKTIHSLVRKCQALGLHREADENLLFAPTFSTVMFNHPDPEPEPEPEVIPAIITGLSVGGGDASVKSGQATLGGVSAATASKSQTGSATGGAAAAEDDTPTPTPALEEVSAEELERRQLLAELSEASNLMSESVTPEAAEFWRAHVTDLQSRLREINGEGANSNTELSPDTLASPTLPAQEQTTQHPPNAAQQQQAQAVQQAQVQTQLKQTEQEQSQQAKAAATPAATPATARTFTATAVAAAAASFNSAINQAATGTPSTPVTTTDQPNQQRSTTLPGVDPTLADAPIMDVIAPADLPGGSTFEVEIEGRGFLATVPAGGVRAGETFCCYMRELSAEGPQIPVGAWRDSFFSCFAHGIFHPSLLNAVFCPLVMLSQVMTRLGLDFMGREVAAGELPTSTSSMMTGIVVFWCTMNIGIFAAYNYKWSSNMELSYADVAAAILLNVIGFVYTLVATTATRRSIRQKFLIEDEENCEAPRDMVAAAFCLPCTVSQMARHTAVYSKYEGVCCNDTGIPDYVGSDLADVNKPKQGAYMV